MPISVSDAQFRYDNQEPKWNDEYSPQWLAYGKLTMAKKEKICARYMDYVGGWELYSDYTHGDGGKVVEYVTDKLFSSFYDWLENQPENEIW